MADVPRLNGDDDRGILIGMALAAAILVREFDQPTMAQEIAGAAGLTLEALATLGLEEYDTEPLKKILT